MKKAMMVLLLCGVASMVSANEATDKMYLNCSGNSSSEAKATLWKAYCYGFLFGHYSSVVGSPSPVYCNDRVTTEQLDLAFRTWYLGGGRESDEALYSALWGVWIDAEFCHVDKKRFSLEFGGEFAPSTGVEEQQLFDEGAGGEVH